MDFNMAKHSPERWIAPLNNGMIRDKNNIIIAEAYTKENAERIVKCVNAFEGINDPEAFLEMLRSYGEEK